MLGFQINNEYHEIDDFEITSIFKDGGTLEEIYNDIDGQDVSDEIETLVDSHLNEFIHFSENFHDLLTDHTGLIIKLMDTEVKGLIQWLIDTDLRNVPLVTSGGDWWLKDRCVKVLETTTGPKGWTTATWDVPANAKGVLYMQAWVGATVTPVAVEDVD